nr:hypothetical protein CFP56_22838 [Quercus suber]
MGGSWGGSTISKPNSMLFGSLRAKANLKTKQRLKAIEQHLPSIGDWSSRTPEHILSPLIGDRSRAYRRSLAPHRRSLVSDGHCLNQPALAFSLPAPVLPQGGHFLYSHRSQILSLPRRTSLLSRNSHVECDVVDPKQRDAMRSTKQADNFGPWLVVTRKRQSNKGAKYKTEGSGTGYLRVSGGNAYLYVGLRSNDTRVRKRKPDKAHPRNPIQSHKDLSANRGEHRLGFALASDFMEANQIRLQKVPEALLNFPLLSILSSSAMGSAHQAIQISCSHSASNESGHDLDKVDSKQSAPSGEASGEEANEDGDINYRGQKQQTGSPGLDGDHPSLFEHQGGLRTTYGLAISNVGERSVDGEAEAGGMEFRGGGDMPNPC